MECPCQSGKAFSQCCQPLIEGLQQAETAEQLMRARYTAHTQINMDFIERTHDPRTRGDLDMAGNREWAETTNWQGLTILATDKGGVNDETGTVEFIATYESEHGPQEHHELSIFHKHNGTWFYADSTQPKGRTVVRQEPKVGRNDPCPCGSGKKFKKCCGSG